MHKRDRIVHKNHSGLPLILPISIKLKTNNYGNTFGNRKAGSPSFI